MNKPAFMKNAFKGRLGRLGYLLGGLYVAAITLTLGELMNYGERMIDSSAIGWLVQRPISGLASARWRCCAV